MQMNHNHFSLREYLLCSLALVTVLLLCVCVGSVNVPLKDTVTAIWNSVFGQPVPEGVSKSIILSVRLPRVLCVALSGAALSLCGAAMQGLLRNPLADGDAVRFRVADADPVPGLRAG